MTTDGIINILLAVAVPGLMALIGGVLAARTLPSPSGRRSPEVYLWSSLLILLFLVSVVLAFVQQVRNSSQQKIAEQAATTEKLEASGSAKYTQGELDSINKVLTALVQSKPSNGDDYKETIRALLQVTKTASSAGPVGLKGLSNSELKSKALGLVADIGTVEQQFERDESAVTSSRHYDPTKSKTELDTLQSVFLANMGRVDAQEQARWIPLQAESRVMIDELLSRLPPDVAPKDQAVLRIVHMAVDQGGLAGAYPLRSVAYYINQLALLLPGDAKAKRR